jgi:hypothetical protein
MMKRCKVNEKYDQTIDDQTIDAKSNNPILSKVKTDILKRR